MLLLQNDGVQHQVAHLLIIIFRKCIKCCEEVFRLNKFWLFFLRLINKLVIQELVQKSLDDDSIFIAASGQAIVHGRLFQPVNQFISLLLDCLYIHSYFVI